MIEKEKIIIKHTTRDMLQNNVIWSVRSMTRFDWLINLLKILTSYVLVVDRSTAVSS